MQSEVQTVFVDAESCWPTLCRYTLASASHLQVCAMDNPTFSEHVLSSSSAVSLNQAHTRKEKEVVVCVALFSRLGRACESFLRLVQLLMPAPVVACERRNVDVL